MKALNPLTKISIIISIIVIMLGYAVYERNKYWTATEKSNELILAKLPNFYLPELETDTAINAPKMLEGSRGLIVHFWGTWCAPCEAEFPELIKWATALSDKNVKFLLIAVNDDKNKVRAFLKRFKLPNNVTIATDFQGNSMSLFGTVKVPETYLFNAKGAHLNKFVGPQDWANTSFTEQINRLLGQTP